MHSTFCTKRASNERAKSRNHFNLKQRRVSPPSLSSSRVSRVSRVPPPSVAINKGREEQKFNSQLTAGRPLTSRARPTFVIRGRRRRRPSSATAPVPRTTAASGRIIALKGALVEKQRQTERERETHTRVSVTMSFSRGRLIIARR